MAASGAKTLPAIGFLTVCQHAEHGLFGGYLALNSSGRPLEFHCTAPVKPNRAQEILYGPALKPFLYGEQIGRTLLEKARIEPLAVCTDLEILLAVREFVVSPVVWVCPPPDETAAAAELHGDRFAFGRFQAAVAGSHREDRETIRERLSSLGDSLDLLEPFGRIREAIEEAQRAARPAAA